MNRQARRHTQTVTGKVLNISPMVPSGPVPNDGPSTVTVHGVCRSCSTRTFLWLPGRICAGCVDRVLKLAEGQSVDAMLAYLEELDEAEEVGA